MLVLLIEQSSLIFSFRIGPTYTVLILFASLCNARNHPGFSPGIHGSSTIFINILNSPLTSLRNDLIVLLQDVDGNEISRTGIEAKSIVEKGVWEDLFSLGGGHLHLKLQFILNDEEREKIRMMRQSALKKKHDELLNSSSLRSAESATTARSAALPLCTNDEVSGLPKRHLQLEAVSDREKNSPVHNNKKPGFGNVVGAESDQKQLNPNIADQNRKMPSTASVSQAVDLTQLQCKDLIKKPAIHSPSMEDPQRAIGSKGRAISLGRPEKNVASMDNLIHPNLKNSLDYPEKQNPLGKTPSNVRKMISAFESGLVQDTRFHIKSPPTKCQFSEIETNVSYTNQQSKDDKAQDTELAGFLKGRIRGASHAGELQQAPVYIRESREQFNLLSNVSYKETKQLEELSTIKILNKQTDSIARNKFKVTHKTDTEEEKCNKDLMSTSTFETFTVSGKMLEKYSGRNHPCDLFSCKRNSRWGIASKGSHESCIQGASPHKLDSVLHFEDKFYSVESSSAWIFPDERRKFCIQTGGKILMDLLESQVKRRISHQRSLDISILEVADKVSKYFYLVFWLIIISSKERFESRCFGEQEISHKLRKADHIILVLLAPKNMTKERKKLCAVCLTGLGTPVLSLLSTKMQHLLELELELELR